MIDAWSGPTPTPQQFPANEPNGIRKLLDKFKALELQVKESTSNLLRTAGIYLSPAGMTIDSSLTVGGSETVNGPLAVHGPADFDGDTTIGGTLAVTGSETVTGPLAVHGTADFDGDTTIGGNAAITGTLSLPAGIIDNAALSSPVVADIVNLTNTGFTVPANPTWGNAVSTTITVPPGCTQLLATCTAEAYAINPNTTGGSNGTGGDILDCRVLLNGSASAGYGIGLSGSNGFTSSSSSGSFHFSGLTPGATLSIATQVLAVYQAFGSNVDNKATINATLIWLR